MIYAVINYLIYNNNNQSASNNVNLSDTSKSFTQKAPPKLDPIKFDPPKKAPPKLDPIKFDPPKESPYKGNQLRNGASPFDDCFGKGWYDGDAWILFKNDNKYDAVVCLVKVSTGRTIRNEYIRAGTDFKMTRVPTGTYYIKTYQGNDWNPTKLNFCGIKGAFESNVHCSKSDGSDDRIKIENNRHSHSTWTITLYTVQNGNMESEPINESEFFN
jgi:hypothetical protein